MLRFLNDNSPAFQGVGSLLQAFAAVAAVVGAAFWWKRQGEQKPRAKLDLNIDHVSLEDGSILLRVQLLVENAGRILLKVNSVRLDVAQVRPIPYDQGVPFGFKRTVTAEEFDWPCIAFQEFKAQEHEYEPGENGPLNYEFRLTDVSPEVLSVYAHVNNETKDSLGWTTTKLYRIETITTSNI